MGIIYIGGTPGVGKTTIAKELAKATGLPWISVAELVKKEKLYVGYDDSLRAYVVDIEAVRSRLNAIAKGKRVIVESHVANVVPPELVEVAVILRLDPRELMKRLERRRYSRDKILQNVQAEILDSCLIEAVELFGADKVVEIDTTGKTVEEVVGEVLRAIEGKGGARPGSIDWFNRLGEEVFKYLKEETS